MDICLMVKNRNSNHIHFVKDNRWTLLKNRIKQCTGKLYVLMDENTMQECYPLLVQAVPELKEAELLEIEPGEESKNLQIAVGLWETLSEQNAGRDSLLINLGGGVVCDLGGFVASTYKRGISFINVPSSLLAMVDAAIGGKTGIDFLTYKNQIGTFSHAEAVYIWTEFLKSLPKKELLAGHAESIKHSLIADQLLWKDFVSNPTNDISSKDIIKRSMQIKKNIVETDPLENSDRKLLNFGHTIGHAIESFFLSQQKAILHGEAVAAGIICESYLSHKISGLSENCFSEIHSYIDSLFTRIQFSEADLPPIVQLIMQDKKNVGGKNRFVLLEGIGKAVYNREVDADLINASLSFYLGS